MPQPIERPGRSSETHVFQRKDRPSKVRGDDFKRLVEDDDSKAVKNKRADRDKQQLSPYDPRNKKGAEITASQQGAVTNEPQGDIAGVLPKSEDVAKALSSTQFVQERGDISVVNPLAMQVPEIQSVIDAKGEGVSRIPQVSEIIEAIENEMLVLEKGGDTETTVKMGKNSLFAGTEITVTKFTTDPTTFNIRLSNLTAEMRELFDAANAKNDLMRTLGERGFAVHMIETSYQPFESRLADIQGFRQAQRDMAEQQEKQDQKGGKKNR